MGANKRSTSQTFRAADTHGSALWTSGFWGWVPVSQSPPSHNAKTRVPTAGASQPNCQLRLRYWRRKIHKAAPAANGRNGYSHSNPLLAAVETMPAARIRRKGAR